MLAGSWPGGGAAPGAAPAALPETAAGPVGALTAWAG